MCYGPVLSPVARSYARVLRSCTITMSYVPWHCPISCGLVSLVLALASMVLALVSMVLALVSLIIALVSMVIALVSMVIALVSTVSLVLVLVSLVLTAYSHACGHIPRSDSRV